MAVEQQFKEDDKKKDPITGAPAIGGSQGAATPVSSLQKPSSSGRFTNIQNYLNANKQSNLGQGVSQRIGNVASDVSKDVNKERESFQQKTADAFKPYEGGKQFAQQGIQNATQFLTDDPNTAQDESKSNLDRFTTIRQGQYGGPKELSNLATLRAGAENVANLAGLTSNEAGRQTLLSSFFNKPSYTQGQKSLDNLLLQADPRQIRALQSVRSTSAETNRNLNQAANQARTVGTNTAQQIAQLGKEVTGELSQEDKSRNKALDEKLAQIQQDELDRTSRYKQTLKDIQSGVISASDAQRLGLTPEGGEISLYGLDLNNYLNTDIYGGPMSREAVANQEEAARINALARLAGSAVGPINMSNINKYTSSAQNIRDNFASDLARQRAEYQALEARRAGEAAKFDRLQGLFNDVSNAQQNAAQRAIQTGKDPQAAIMDNRGSGYSELMQTLYGGNRPDFSLTGGTNNPVYQALQQQRSDALRDVEARLAALRNKLRVVNR